MVAISVRGRDGAEVFFKLRRTSALKKVMCVYAERQNITLSGFRFSFHGTPIDETVTPDDLGMKDGDRVDAEFG